MKPNYIATPFAAGLLLTATPQGRATSPRQRSVSGVIVSLKWEAHTLTDATGKDAKPLVSILNHSTRFKHRGHYVGNGVLGSVFG